MITVGITDKNEDWLASKGKKKPKDKTKEKKSSETAEAIVERFKQQKT